VLVLKMLVVVAMAAQASAPAAPTAQSAQAIRITPSVVGEIDLGKIKGALVRQLAWSPDGSEFYLMTYDANPDASIKAAYHYLIPAAGGAPKRVDVQPEWAATYWAWKSTQAAPGDPTFKIEPATDQKREDAVAIPMGGEMAKGGVGDPTGGMSTQAAMEAGRAMRNNNVYTLRLKGEIVGEWVNHPIVPGLTFGWGPAKTGLIAFSERQSGRLIIMDKTGAKQKIDDTKGVVLPAWTEDGSRLAYLESRSRTKYALVVAKVQ
jgi:hypothetical protein